jgi:hypothetical protein
MCLFPKLIKNRKYVKNKKNGGNVPPVKDSRVTVVPVGCGKCMECRKQKAREWNVRLQEDIRENKNGKFVTFTFSDEELNKLEKKIKGLSGYDRDNEVCRIAVRRFTENWRSKYKKSVRHWIVTEIGGKNTERVHMHGILWTDKSIEEIQEKWIYGNVILGDGKGKHYVNEETVGYIVKYISKVDKKHKEYISKMFVSKGIGKGYFNRKDYKRNKYKEGETIETYKSRTGYEMAMPVYWRNKIYSEEEREKLWLEKLDKEERWVDKVRVEYIEGEKNEEYYNLLKNKRQKNKRLGYGDDKINWEREKYEKERRNLKVKERIEKLSRLKA